jgi:hypothetical protein
MPLNYDLDDNGASAAYNANTMVMPETLRQQTVLSGIELDSAGSIDPSDTFTYTTLANGMPILNSYPSNPSKATIFIDLDGDPYVLNGSACAPYSEDGDSTTFNLAEQATIVDGWRQMSMYYSMFDVNVTTIQPNVSTYPTAWTVITPNEGNGWSWVGNFPNTSSNSFENTYFMQSRETGIAHEVGHTFGNWHTSDYDNLGNKTAEYSSGLYAASPSPLQGPLMGVDFAGILHKWTIWHSSSGVTSLQDDMAIIANHIDEHAPSGYTGDGYRPDDVGNTRATATALTVTGVTQSDTGVIERLTDVDYYSFTSAGGTYSITAGHDDPSGVDLKMSIYDSSGNLLATEDGDPRAQPYTMVNNQELTLNLAAGTYYVALESHGNYCDSGQYNLRVDPLPDGWIGDDIGLANYPGYSSYNAATSTYTVAGSGDDIWNTSDGFQFLHQTLSGNGSIIAKVASITNTDGSAKAGVMIRDSLDGGSSFADVIMTPNYSVYGQDRVTANGGCGTVGSSGGSAARWVQIVRSGTQQGTFGNTFTFKVSNNGTSWSNLGTATIVMGKDVLIGLVSTSHNNYTINPATFTNVSFTGTLNPTPTANALSAPDPLSVSGKTSTSVSLSWTNVSGEDGYSIERSKDNITFTEVGTTATDVTTFTDSGLSDGLRYFYRVRATVGSGAARTFSTPSAVVNAVTRAGAVSNLRIVSYTTSNLVLDWTDASGETGYRIERSLNGTTWATAGSVGKNVPMYSNTGLGTGTQYYYRVVTLDASGDAATSNVATTFTRLASPTGLAFDSILFGSMTFHWSAVTNATNYTIERSTDGGSTYTTLASNVTATTYTDSGLTSLQEYYYRVTAANSYTISGTPSTAIHAIAPNANLAPPWATQDIGGVGLVGTAGNDSGTFTLIGSGADIWGTGDEFRYVYQPLVGDGSIIAQVASLQNTNAWAKAGVMIRESLDAGSRHAMTVVTSGNGTAFQYRTTANNSSTTVAGPAVTAPYFVKITRSGNTFTSEVSADGITWATVGSTTITMGTTAYVGLALTSHDDTVLNTATFTNVSISNVGPTITTAATATPATVTGTTTALSVVATDDHGESNLTYTWTATTVPAGATPPTYSLNGTNAAKNTTATFYKTGSYVFQVTVTDTSGMTVSSSTSTVNVNSAVASISVTPGSVTLPGGGHQQFSASALDQFGNAMSPTFTWSATSGSITSGGYYTAGTTTPVTITASSGGVQGTAAVLVDTHVPTVATPAAVGTNPVTGTTAVLSVLGADVEGEANLTYTWTAFNLPDGATPPTYSNNGTNAAKTTTATFYKIGFYRMRVLITDAAGQSVASFVNLTVNSTFSGIIISPTSANLPPAGTQQFLATAKDQFGDEFTPVPTLTWMASAGTIDANGFFTAPTTTTTATIYATSGSVTSNIATISTVNTGPTVTTPAAANPNPTTGTSILVSVLGADDWGESGLTYTWATFLKPTGAPEPIFSINGTNAAKNAMATFSVAGGYRLRALITDSGGLTAASFVVVSVSQTVTSIVVTPDSTAVLPGGTQLFTAAAFDQFGDAMPATISWSATTGNINASGLYTAPLTPNVAATITATFGSVQGTAIANIGDRPPTNISISNAAVNENAVGATIGTLSTTDPDLGETFTYALQSDPTSKFEISGATLRLKDGESLDREATPTINLLIRSTDAGGLYFEKSFTITVNNVPETPTDLVLSNASVNENLAGAAIGALSTVDPDLGDTFTYALQSDPTNKFEIVSATLKLKDGESLDFETTPTVELLIRSTDAGGLYFEKSFTITVNNIPETPTDIVLSNATIDENLAGGAIGMLSTIPDPGGAVYTIENDPTNKFEIVGATLQLKTGESLNYEATPEVILAIRSTAGSQIVDVALTIMVNDLAETITVGASDWTAAGLTLKIGDDAKLHVYRTGTTDDAVLPHNPSKVLGIEVTGNGTGDVLAIDSTAANVANLTISQAKAQAATINNTATTVLSGTLSVGSIVCDTLIIGSNSTAASAAGSAKAANMPIAIAARMPVDEMRPAVSATPVAIAASIPTTETASSAAATVNVTSIVAISSQAPVEASIPLVRGFEKSVAVSSKPSSVSSPLQSPLEEPLSESLFASAGLDRILSNNPSISIPKTVSLYDSAPAWGIELATDVKAPVSTASHFDRATLSVALQSLLGESRQAGDEDEDFGPADADDLLVSVKLQKKAVDAFYLAIDARN